MNAKRGRPSKLNAATTERVVSAIERGCFLKMAAALAGIDEWTLHRWLRRGRIADGRDDVPEKEAIFAEFVRRVEHALAVAEVRDVVRIRAASQTDWRAAAWLLERRAPDRWGR